MGFTDQDYTPDYNVEDYALFYCPLCDKDTLHQVVAMEFDNYDIKCQHCGTTSLTRFDYFDRYEEEAMHWSAEIAQFMGDDGELYI